MTRDGEIPAIFNPKRVRTPSVVVTGDSSTNGPYSTNQTGGGGGGGPGACSSTSAVAPGVQSAQNGSGTGGTGSCGFSNVLTSSNPQITHQDSISSSQQDPNEVIIIPADTPTSAPGSHSAGHHFGGGGGGGGGGDSSDTQTEQQQANGHGEEPELRFRKLQACKESCCSELARKMYFGVCVTILMTASWVGATHCIKYMYKYRAPYDDLLNDDQDTSSSRADLSTELEDILAISDSSLHHVEDATEMFNIPPRQPVYFSAPFFAAWFFTNFSLLFFPIYLLGLVSTRKCEKLSDILGDVLRGFRERGFTVGRFLNRCLCFCILWLVTTYLYTLSLHVLYATDALALFATNVACVYLLSWVILHEQFVGVRIVAIILCDTGIALLAYMDGITESRTLSGVVLATLAGAGYAVFRVMFRKVMGDPPVSQIAFIFTALGFLNALLLWPVVLGLYLTGTESLTSESIPWNLLFAASLLLLVFHVLMQFSAAVTYNMFVTLGLITAVPVSGALDVILYSANFAGMKLAGVILIGIGFFLVMFPANWPDYITRLLRSIIMLGHNARWGRGPRSGTSTGQHPTIIDYRTGYIRSHLRSPSGRVR
ncbi:solute carrier family 35 member F3 isoform X2 [Drosophila takahashii]|uniref:solute carrier family 35 member F3 isoform X2 n=1 Tax=Drosophila takahashii TaxID=29030 RepID=UPI003899017B